MLLKQPYPVCCSKGAEASSVGGLFQLLDCTEHEIRILSTRSVQVGYGLGRESEGLQFFQWTQGVGQKADLKA